MKLIYRPAGRAAEYADYAANLYRGCGHGCKYCYVPLCLKTDRDGYHASPQARANALEAFERDCVAASGRIANVLLSFSTDPCQPINDELGLTEGAITAAHGSGIGIQLLTKGGRRAFRSIEMLGDADAFATTLTFSQEDDSRRWEPLAAVPAERMESLRRAYERGVFTWVSLEPVIDPGQTLELIRQTLGFVCQYKIGKLNYAQTPEPVDWRKFAEEAMELIRSAGRAYYIKQELRRAAGMEEHEYWPEAARRYPPEAAPSEAPMF